MSYEHYRKRLEELVGKPPEFDPSKTLDEQVPSWIAWSERKKLLRRFEIAQSNEDQRQKES